MFQVDAKIISHTKIAKIYYLLRLEVPSLFKQAQPGQFVHLKINNTDYPLLRRPFSIYRSTLVNKRCYIDILYEIKGQGTQLLSQRVAGESLNIIGPLGKGFDYEAQNKQGKINIIIAGGMGIAPLNFLAEKLNKSKNIVLIGSATASKILCEEELKKLGCEVKIATEDGSRGFRGKVTDLFQKILSSDFCLPAKALVAGHLPARQSISGGSSVLYACGPKAMLTMLAKICLIRKIPLQVSLEEFMGCGIGACLGCTIQTKYGFKRVCSDGPVFKAEDIVWKF
jgi:dihydroorotate dehydrogenase electron transfer subunit